MLPVSGLYMAFYRYGGFGTWPSLLMTKLVLGIVVIAMFIYVYFFPFDRLHRALDDSNPALVAHSVQQIRRIVAINLGRGLVIVIAASGARYL